MKCAVRASTNAGMVDSVASTVGVMPRSRMAWEVMGPMEASVIPAGGSERGGLQEGGEVVGGGGAGEGDGVGRVILEELS